MTAPAHESSRLVFREAEQPEGAVTASEPAAPPSAVPESAASEPTAAAQSSLLDSLKVASYRPATAEGSRLDAFLREPSPARALQLWLGSSPGWDREQVLWKLNRDIAAIDRSINVQLNAILHQAAFQKLESAWRGLRYLVDRAYEEGRRDIKIRVLNASWRDLERDAERAVEFDHSQLFRKVYEEEFGSPGGEPFGVLLGDFEIRPRPAPGYPHDDMATLASLAGVAAAAFCPFVTAVSPAMFGLDDFDGLEYRLDHAKTLQQLDYLKWNALRKSDDARFVGLVLPRVLMRLPYADDGTRVDGFCFHEDVAGPDRRKYLWGNAVYALGGVIIRAFAQTGWLADIRGVQQNVDGGGLVCDLPAHSFGTDRRGVALKSSTDVIVTDVLERELSDLGFTCLCDCQDTEFSAFYSSPSIQQPRQFDRSVATVNARLSAMLSYVLCASRFAHYLKVLGRERVGTFPEPDEIQVYLQDWIAQYVTPDSEASPETKAAHPLREANVEVRRVLDKPGAYQCIMRLAPHYELEDMSATVRLTTELAPARPM